MVRPEPYVPVIVRFLFVIPAERVAAGFSGFLVEEYPREETPSRFDTCRGRAGYIRWIVDEDQPNAKHIPKNGRTKIGPHVAAAFRLLILTGARLREILELKWEYVDLQRGLLLLPDSKTGQKAIILNGPALAILEKVPKVDDNFVIASDIEGQSRHDLNKPWKLISTRAELVGVRIHDLRHTHASYGAGAGFGLPIIGKLLGHSQPATTARYAHLDSDPLRRASNEIASQISRAMGEQALSSPNPSLAEAD